MAPEEKAALLLTAKQSVEDRSSNTHCYKHHHKKIKSFLPSTERVEDCSYRIHKTMSTTTRLAMKRRNIYLKKQQLYINYVEIISCSNWFW